MTQHVEQELRSHFERRAAAVQIPPAPIPALGDEIRHDRRRRVARTALAAACAVTVAVGATLVAGQFGRHRAITPADRHRSWDLTTVPTAGDLAHDLLWMRQATARLESAAHGHVTHVVFAGRLPVGAAFVAYVTTNRTSYLNSLYSPTGRAADLTEPDFTRGGVWLDPANPRGYSLAVSGPDRQRYFVVVPFAPGAAVEVSAGPRIGRDGSVTRDWLRAPTRDGAAIGRLEPVTLQLPQVRIDGGDRRDFVDAQVVNTQSARITIERQWGALWGDLGRWPDPNLGAGALDTILAVTNRSDVTLEPVFHGREQPSGFDVLAGIVRLRDGGALQVVTVFDDRARPSSVSTVYAGRPVPADQARNTPISWIEDAGATGTVTRARIIRPGAAKIVIRDIGTRPCAGRRVLGTALPDRNGLATIPVELPNACLDPVPSIPWDGVLGTWRVVAIAYDAAGHEIGRSPLRVTDADLLPGTR